MSETEQEHLLTNIIGHATHGPGLDADVARRVGDLVTLDLEQSDPDALEDAPTGPAPGWFPDYRDTNIRHYWDGTSVTHSEHWDRITWTRM